MLWVEIIILYLKGKADIFNLTSFDDFSNLKDYYCYLQKTKLGS